MSGMASHDFLQVNGEKEGLRPRRFSSTYPYIQHVRSMLDRYPNLNRFYKSMVSESKNGLAESSRAAVIEIEQHGVQQKRFNGPIDLQRYLDGSSPLYSPACKRRLFLLEGMAPDYVEALGSHFEIDPYVFAEQLLRGGTRDGETPRLPSRRDPDRYFTMQYIEARTFGEGMDDLGARCIYQDRKIWATKINSKFDGVGHVHRIASFWAREMADGGFDALILVDPPMGDHIKIGKGGPKKNQKVESKLQHGGYVDFLPFETDREIPSGPGTLDTGPIRMSPYDDILFYWRKLDRFPKIHRSILDGTADPSICSYFLKKIVASNWMPPLLYFDATLDRLEYALARSNVEGLTGAARHWSDVEYWHRRCSKSCDQLEQSLFNLGRDPFSNHEIFIPRSRIATRTENEKCEEDFLYIYRQMQELKARSQRLGFSLSNLIGIIESKRSADEAHSIKVLTLLGMLFVPLAFTSGIFSMSGNFAPGGSKFWVYFATGIPIVGLVFCVAFVSSGLEALRLKKRRIVRHLEVSYANHTGKDLEKAAEPEFKFTRVETWSKRLRKEK